MTAGLRIGEVARRAGVSVDTLRFYERRGLVAAPRRRPSGYRAYSPEVVERVRLVKRLQTLGLSLDEVRDLLREADAGSASCEGSRPRLEQTLARLDARVSELQRVRSRLAEALADCQSGRCDVAAGVCGPGDP